MRLVILICFSTLWVSDALSAQKKPVFRKPADRWAYVPSGTLTKAGGDSTAVKAFYMQKTEVSNLDYKEFVAAVAQSGNAQKLKTVLPDTLVWHMPNAYNEPYVEYYFRHPAYAHYPVVGVSHEAAELYCDWLTDVYNARLKELFPKLKVKAVEVRLPDENEWIWAAKGGHADAVYPWGAPYLRNAKGDMMCNIACVGDESISRDLKERKFVYRRPEERNMSADNADITAPVKSYWPNDYELYNMAGNVAEMLAQPGTTKGGSWYTGGYDARIDAADPNQGGTQPTAFIGFRPVFTVVPL